MLLDKAELVSTIPFLCNGARGNKGAWPDHPPDPAPLKERPALLSRSFAAFAALARESLLRG